MGWCSYRSGDLRRYDWSPVDDLYPKGIPFNAKAHWTLIARVLTLTARVLDLKHVAV